MPTSDTSEMGLENLIATVLTSSSGYVGGDPTDYDRDHAVDLVKFLAFLRSTQPEVVEQLGFQEMAGGHDLLSNLYAARHMSLR
jgi:type I restriction enzyme, R subunit